MKQLFKRKLKNVILWLLIIFAVLFIFRLMYGYTKTFDDTPNQTQFFNNISNSKRNYATKKYKVKSNTTNQSAIKVDQKYEKIAAIKTKSSDFEKEEESSRETIKKLDALIQFE